MILSDIGANTLLLHPDVWLQGKTDAQPAKLLRDYVADGGGLMMIGGYFSFQGINGGARWHKTPVEQVLPVDLPALRRPGRGAGGLRRRAGAGPSIPILAGLDGEWPLLLGFNEVVSRTPGREVLATRLRRT